MKKVQEQESQEEKVEFLVLSTELVQRILNFVAEYPLKDTLGLFNDIQHGAKPLPPVKE